MYISYLPDTYTYVCVSGGKKCFFFFRKIWCALFSYQLRLKNLPFSLSPTNSSSYYTTSRSQFTVNSKTTLVSKTLFIINLKQILLIVLRSLYCFNIIVPPCNLVRPTKFTHTDHILSYCTTNTLKIHTKHCTKN